MKLFCQEIGQKRNSRGRTVRTRFIFDPDDNFILEEAGIAGVEEFCLLALTVQNKLKIAYANSRGAYLNNLSHLFNFQIESRRYDAVGSYKSVVRNVYVCP
eukprot:398212_1